MLDLWRSRLAYFTSSHSLEPVVLDCGYEGDSRVSAAYASDFVMGFLISCCRGADAGTDAIISGRL